MGSKPSTSITVIPPPSAEEKELIGLNVELARKQLEAFDSLAPFQAQLLETSTRELARQNEQSDILNQLITPEDQAKAIAAEFERTQKLGPIQDELLQLQLEQLRTGGAATPEQIERIKEATDLGIEAGSADIDASTTRGIGLIADELANARGLRLSDSPISSEAALLAREGEIQKGSLIKNLRAGEASARLNFPLAVQQITSGINQNQQNIIQAASNFQAQLRQQAFQNRLAISGQASGQGLGLASVGGVGLGALNSLTSARLGQPFTTGSQGIGLSEISGGISALGGLAGGIGIAGLAF